MGESLWGTEPTGIRSIVGVCHLRATNRGVERAPHRRRITQIEYGPEFGYDSELIGRVVALPCLRGP